MKFIAKAALIISLPFVAAPALADECLKIGSPTEAGGVSAHLRPIVNKAFKEAGMCIEDVRIPAKRKQKELANGRLDGEWVRVMPYIKAMKDHVIHVPTPLMSGVGYIATMSGGDFKPKTLKEIGDKNIGYVHGVKWHEMFVNKLKNKSKAKKFALLFKKAQAGRIDGFLVDSLTLGALQKAGMIKKTDLHLSEPIIDMSGYLLLHKKNAALAPKLDAALKKVLGKN